MVSAWAAGMPSAAAATIVQAQMPIKRRRHPNTAIALSSTLHTTSRIAAEPQQELTANW
jgi:hypothetical protein